MNTNYKELDKLKIKEQDCIIKNGKIQLKLNRQKEVIEEIPISHKNSLIVDIGLTADLKAYDTVQNKKHSFKLAIVEFWLYNPDTDKFILLPSTLETLRYV